MVVGMCWYTCGSPVLIQKWIPSYPQLNIFQMPPKEGSNLTINSQQMFLLSCPFAHSCYCWLFLTGFWDTISIGSTATWMLVKVKVIQSCLTLCNPMNYTVWNSPGQNTGVSSLSLLQGIFPTQRLNDRTHVSHNGGRFFTSWATREAQEYWSR